MEQSMLGEVREGGNKFTRLKQPVWEVCGLFIPEIPVFCSLSIAVMATFGGCSFDILSNKWLPAHSVQKVTTTLGASNKTICEHNTRCSIDYADQSTPRERTLPLYIDGRNRTVLRTHTRSGYKNTDIFASTERLSTCPYCTSCTCRLDTAVNSETECTRAL